MWRPEVEGKCFQIIKEAVQRAVHRHGFDPKRPVVLESDASNYAGGCAIKQKTAHGEVVILYDSFCFSPTERRYPTFKKKLCAIIRFLKKWHCYLGGVQTTIIRTDHRPLLGFQNSAGRGNVDGIYARWAEILERSNVENIRTATSASDK